MKHIKSTKAPTQVNTTAKRPPTPRPKPGPVRGPRAKAASAKPAGTGR